MHYRVIWSDGRREFQERVSAPSNNAAASQVLAGGQGRTILRVEEEAPPPPPAPSISGVKAADLTAEQLQRVIAKGVFFGLIAYAILGVLITLAIMAAASAAG